MSDVCKECAGDGYKYYTEIRCDECLGTGKILSELKKAEILLDESLKDFTIKEKQCRDARELFLARCKKFVELNNR